MKKIKSYKEFCNKINEMKLIDVFDEYPDEDEMIWNFVGSSNFKNKDYNIEKKLLKDIIDPEFIKNYKKNAKSWQKRYVKELMNDIENIKNKPIIIEYNNDLKYPTIIDGNHKLIAMYYSDLKYVNVISLEQ